MCKTIVFSDSGVSLFYRARKKIAKSLCAVCPLVIFQYRTEEDLFKKEEKKAKLLKETIPFYLNKFEQTVAENGGYAVGSTVSTIIESRVTIPTLAH